MALGYMYDDALRFCIEYFALYPHTQHHMWDPNEEERDVREVFHGVGKLKRLYAQEMEVIHEHVITNSTPTKALYRYFFLLPHYVHSVLLVVSEWFT
jgi:hypothetical protein